LYEVKVSEKTYNKLKEEVTTYIANKGELKYSTLGLVMCFLRIPLKRKNRYFCSQFVAEVLHKCEAIKLNKKSSLYFPKDFIKHKELKLIFKGNHSGFIEKYVKKSDKK
jgi:inositol transport system substrate-binding protein